MRNVGRVLLWLLGGVLVIACIVLLGVNLYVQSQGTHHRIQQELSQRLGTPLRLRRISVTPWSGLKLNGITIPQEPGGVSGDFLRAQTFQLRVQFWSLFSDRLVIRQVSLIKPEVVWAQNSAGKWRLPALPPEKAVTPSPPAKAAVATPATLLAPVPSASPVATAPALSPNDNRTAFAEQAQSFTPEVRRVTLRDGDFTFLDSAGRVVAKFMGLDFTSSFRTATAVKGSTRIEKISLRDRFFIERLDSPLHYDPEELNFSNISAEAAGGQLSGQFEMQLQTVDSPFHASVKFRDLQAEKLMANAGGPPGMIEGRLEGFLDAAG
ncbi:MAG: AsmA family protein, partial [Chthoniobacterales bacterium]|nr:AsmA family protein [Chthoniobacterales bacterium]